ncbi:adenine phosphoribosyltransferase [Albibacterium indicum]|uniref:adenine phosphoribosyltransferase n=1 Tax=Albibacterium indicum TaxID=2292082 RepID=UPI003742CDB9
MQIIEKTLRTVIRDVYDFPKKGIIFKDITPIFKDAKLCEQIIDAFEQKFKDLDLDAIVGIESRGLLFGFLLANRLSIPFIPIRKEGKLPAETYKQSYDLEYGQATIEIHQDAFEPGAKILMHDDLLATGGTIAAASKLIEKMGGQIMAFAFVVSLDFLQGKDSIRPYCDRIFTLVDY